MEFLRSCGVCDGAKLDPGDGAKLDPGDERSTWRAPEGVQVDHCKRI
jgi:hypothetical protein